jgi:hypothetical protein
MDVRSAIDAAIQLAKAGAVVFPTLGNGAALAEKALDILDDLKAEAPSPRTLEEIEAAHKALYDEMTAKGHALSARLRG